MRILLFVAAFIAALTPGVRAAAPDTSGRHLKGTIVSVSSNAMVVNTPSGSETIALDPKTRVLGVATSTLADVVAGSYVGATLEPQPDGSLKPIEVHIFPASLRGTGEGYHPMSGQPNHMMANAMVEHAAPAKKMMANATVRAVGGSSGGKTVLLVYKGGEKSVTISPLVPIVKYESGTHASLVAGEHVSVTASGAAGGLLASRVVFGENGLIPR